MNDNFDEVPPPVWGRDLVLSESYPVVSRLSGPAGGRSAAHHLIAGTTQALGGASDADPEGLLLRPAPITRRTA